MVLGDIECFEVVVIQLYFRTGHHIKAHAQEDFLELIQNQVEGVLMTDYLLLAGQGHIQTLLHQTLLQSLFLEFGTGFSQQGFDFSPDLVCQMTDYRTLLCGEGAHLLENGSQFALFAQIADPDIFQCLGILSLFQLCLGSRQNVVECFFHNIHLFIVFEKRERGFG